ncbi:MAG: methionyl-tRNA formyltransferase [Bacteroidota bacterium]
MKIVFMGTAEFGLPTLNILVENGYAPISIVTGPDKHAGRGQKIYFSPIKKFALDHRIPLFQPERLKDPFFIRSLIDLHPDLIIVIAFRILPAEVIQIPTIGSFNLHASLLPKYRGAAPIQWAIINGESETGVTTFFLEEKVDMGNIIIQERLLIGSDETAGEVHNRLAELGASVVLKTITVIERGEVHRSVQDDALATPAPKIFKEHGRIDWSKSAIDIHNFIRGLSPRPGAYTFHKEILIKVYRSRVVSIDSSNPTGEIIKSDSVIYVSTGDGMIELIELQQEGKKILNSSEFLRGYKIKEGERLD